MSYNHGISVAEQATSLVSAVSVDTALAVVFGTAPINMGDIENVNKPVLCYSYGDAVSQLGFINNFDAGYTLPEVIYSHFAVYNVSPVVFINVLDPSKHKKDVANEVRLFTGNKLVVDVLGVIKSTVQIVFQTVTMDEGIDYDLLFDDDGYLVIERIEGGSITEGGEVTLSYTNLDASMVTADDIIGGIDANTGVKTGLELISEVFPRFRKVPAVVAAPKFSCEPAVAMLMASKASNINTVFKAIAVADIEHSSVSKYADVAGYKNDNSLNANNLVVCWPKVKQGDKEFYLSTHVLSLFARTDALNNEVPYKSPSNESLLIDSLVNNGKEVILSPDEAAYLNGQGIITALNFIGGYKLWGNRTSIYPANTDVKDCMLPVRRMFAWMANTIVLTYWQKVDYPIRKRTIDNILDSVTYWINGLVATECLVGGRIVFDQSQNPTTDILDGILRFKLYIAPPVPAREIEFTLEYDPAYLETLFN